ncbi:hypothetical protein [Rhodococcus gordoniae]|uniref:hypothetical protein n=1 Tax=Rhodococcus gordoniae TaxID=223392 RepID=UPI0035258B79
MNDRDELESVLVNVLSNAMNYPDPVVMLGKDTGPLREKVVDAILAAGYRKPYTITTADELDALPPGTVMIQEGVRPKFAGSCVVAYGDGLVSDRFGIHYSAEALEELGPLTVIYTPEAQG